MVEEKIRGHTEEHHKATEEEDREAEKDLNVTSVEGLTARELC